MRIVKRSTLSAKALMLCAFALGGAMLPVVSAHTAFAESDAAEADRIARFNKKAGITTTFTSATTSHYQGGGGPATTATEVVASQNQIPMLGPTSDAALKAAQDKYASIVAQGGFPQIPRGSYKNGSKGAGVGALNKHLFMEGYLRIEGTQGEFAQLYTNATEAAVAHFQRNMGLSPTGKVDNATLFELNVSAEERMRTIAANIPRLAIYDKDLGDRYLVVNVPAQQLETVSAGKVFSRHNVIVGRPERPSPVVMTALSTVKFNPYWNAPVSIVERDILPKMVSGTQVLTDMNMKVFAGGPNGVEIDPNTVKFTPANIDKYLFRQEPGPHSAMATAKIEFPSTFGIYLHDTPEPQLFRTSNRFYSSGCIRVEKMPLLVEWVLNGQDGFGAPKISTMAETLERLDVPLATPPQLRVAYLTAWPTAGGTVAFRKDIYNMDSSGFTVGQPMPVGESSPDGLRYVLKPLPRQVSVDAAEAESSNFFSIFGKRPALKNDKTSLATPPKKNLFGAKLASASTVSVDQPVSKTIVFKKAKLGKEKKPFVGLFDWASYKKETPTTLTVTKKLKKLAKKTKPSAAGAVPPEPTITAADTVPPEPTIAVKKKKKIFAANDVPPAKPAN
jgi:L,D-transpeptidase YcbB